MRKRRARADAISRRMPIALLGAVALFASVHRATAEEPASIWEPAIVAFEKADAENPPPTGGLLFVGSSSIRMWKTSDAFPELAPINRGFGGSQIRDSVLYAPRIVIPYAPRTIVFYAGDNDIAGGKSPERVAEDFREFARIVREALPETRLIFVAIKPSLSRWKLRDKMDEANRLVREFADKDDRVEFLDVVPPMLNEKGEPREDIFLPDGLHMNDAGYAIWNDLLRPLIVPRTNPPPVEGEDSAPIQDEAGGGKAPADASE